MRVMNGQFPSIEQMTGQVSERNRNRTEEAPGKGSFAEILSAKQKPPTSGELKFSKHASSRLSNRNIELSDGQLKRLTDGTQKASEKGINESLVIMDELAFIVNVKNSTVITAMDQSEADENVFTNIDGAVIV